MCIVLPLYCWPLYCYRYCTSLTISSLNGDSLCKAPDVLRSLQRPWLHMCAQVVTAISPTALEGSITPSPAVALQRSFNVILSRSHTEERCGIREALTWFTRTHFKQDVSAEAEDGKKTSGLNSAMWQITGVRNDRDRGEDRSPVEAAYRRQVLTAAPFNLTHWASPRLSFMQRRTTSTHWKSNIAEILPIPSVNPESKNGEPERLLCEGFLEVSPRRFTPPVWWISDDLCGPHCVCAPSIIN